MEELAQIQEDSLNERLAAADHVPVHLPPGSRVEDSECLWSGIRTSTDVVAEAPVAQEDDEEAQLKELQAALAM